MAIRAGIIFVAALVCILFRDKLNDFKNHVLEKLHFQSRDERKGYIYTSVIFMIIAVILFLYAITH